MHFACGRIFRCLGSHGLRTSQLIRTEPDELERLGNLAWFYLLPPSVDAIDPLQTVTRYLTDATPIMGRYDGQAIG